MSRGFILALILIGALGFTRGCNSPVAQTIAACLDAGYTAAHCYEWSKGQ